MHTIQGGFKIGKNASEKDKKAFLEKIMETDTTASKFLGGFKK